MQNYINQVIEVSQRLRRSGFQISDEWVGLLLLAGLPEKYGPMIMAIEHSGIDITTDTIKTKTIDLSTEGCSEKTGSAFAGKSYFKKGPRDASTVKNCETKDLSEVTCFKCQQKGHYKNKYPSLKKDFDDFKKSQRKNENKSAFSAVFLNRNLNNTEWYVDSGASEHLTSRKNWLRDVNQEKELSEIMVANQEKISVECVGNIDITTIVDEEDHDIMINDVFYVKLCFLNF